MKKLGYTYRYELLLMLLWLTIIWLIDPRGEFSVNDDWAFAQNTKALLGGTLFFHEWAPMTLIAQTACGALFCKILGYSYFTLRISTLVLGGIGLLYFYKTLVISGHVASISFFATMCLAINPFFLQNAFSFMTEVPFIALLIIATYYAIRYLKHASIQHLIWFTTFCVLACMVRQIGILLPLVLFGVQLVQSFHTRNARSILLTLVPILIVVLALYLYKVWRISFDGPLPASYGNMNVLLENFQRGEFKKVFTIGHSYWAYWGVFCLPFILLALTVLVNKKNIILKMSWLLIALLALWYYLPLWSNVIVSNTLGNLTLGTLVLPNWNYNAITTLHPNDWQNILKLSVYLAAILAAIVGYTFVLHLTTKQDKTQSPKLLATIAILAYFVFLMLHRFVFDRYSLVAMPYVLLLLVPTQWSRRRLVSILSVVVLIPLSYFSIAATHDYMEWNRAWWSGMEHAKKQLKLTNKQLQEDLQHPGNYSYFNKPNNNHTSGAGNYIFSFDTYTNFQSIDSFPYTTYLPLAEKYIYLLREKPLGNTTTQRNQ